MNKHLKIPLAVAGIAVLASITFMPLSDEQFTGHGNADTLSSLYQRWKSNYEQSGHPETLRIGLNYSKALSHELSSATGLAALNLVNGQLQVSVTGLSPQQRYEVWLVDQHQKAAGNSYLKVGELEANSNRQTLNKQLDSRQLGGFTLDAIAVAQAGATPQVGGVLFGSPGLMQRVYYNERFVATSRIGGVDIASKANAAGGFGFLLPKPAEALAATKSAKVQLSDLIAKGQKIFTEETFAGNGRTCATCHRPDNNHTLDTDYIAKLPKNDPLFVAEFNPVLAKLEKPALLRQFGLILTNVDGFDKPEIMRSVPHLLGMALSLAFERAANAGEFSQDEDYFLEHDVIAQQEGRHTQAIGWSQDGAPDGGSLRDFAKGAVKQHLPKTLNRVENTDFRMPTEDELDALEAYMLSLGRNAELNLAAMTFKSPLVQKGLLLFNSKNNPGQTLNNGFPVGGNPIFGATANCNGCHQNAGAISSSTGANPTRDTGVERMRDQLHHLADPSVAYDGGFGQVLLTDCGPDFDQPCYSDASVDPHNIRPGNHMRLNRFNTPSLVEAADTGPYFHNNSISTLEETVAYYNTQAFNQSPGAFTSKGVNRQVQLDSSQVLAVAMFLRAINVLENIRSSNQLDQNAMDASAAVSLRTLKLAIADTKDAIEVLNQAVFNPYPEALAKLKQALQYEHEASSGMSFLGNRSKLLQNAIALKNQARNLIVTGS